MNAIMRQLKVLSVIIIAIGTLLNLTIVFMPIGIPIIWLGALVYLPVYIHRKVNEEKRSGN